MLKYSRTVKNQCNDGVCRTSTLLVNVGLAKKRMLDPIYAFSYKSFREKKM